MFLQDKYKQVLKQDDWVLYLTLQNLTYSKSNVYWGRVLSLDLDENRVQLWESDLDGYYQKTKNVPSCYCIKIIEPPEKIRNLYYEWVEEQKEK